MSKRWMVIGGTGLLGSTLLRHLKEMGAEIIALSNSRRLAIEKVEWIHQNLLDEFSVKSLLRAYQPDVIVYATGLTSVDQCETDVTRAMQLNSIIPADFAKAAAKNSSQYVYISTDALFDGEMPHTTELSQPEPINVYGYSKLYGEQLVQHFNKEALILRTNFYGKGLPWRVSFSDWLWNQYSESKAFNAFSDCYFSPIDLDSLASSLINAVHLNALGVYNVAGSERLSKYDFAVYFAKYFGFDPTLAKHSKIEDAHLLAPRQRDMSFDVRKLSKLLNITMPTIKQGFENMAPHYLSKEEV